MSTAARVRAEKSEHPERFCAEPSCLWRVKHVRGGDDTPCPKHSDERAASLRRLKADINAHTSTEES